MLALRRVPTIAVAKTAIATPQPAPASGARIAIASPLPASTATIPAKSVAVLPFANESGDKSQQFFSDGLSDDLITALSQFAGLKVISRNSAFQFRDSKDPSAEIGKLLGVAHLLEGSVQRAGDEVRITATLVNAGDGSIVWSQRYDKPYKDLFALQDAITNAVADALKAKLLTTSGAVVQSDRPPSGNLAAYAAYLQAKANSALGTAQGQRDALADLHEAIRADPHYALAYAALSERRVTKYRAGHTQTDGPQDVAQARAAIKTALTLGPDLAATHVAHGFLLYSIDFDWYGAEAEYRRALQLAPNQPRAKAQLATVLATLGHDRTAIALQRAAITVSPRDAGNWMVLSYMLVGRAQFAAAEQAIRKLMALSPSGGNTFTRLAIIEVLRGNPEQALDYARKEPSPEWQRFGIAMAAQIGPSRSAANAALRDLIAQDADTAAYQIAQVYALRRDPGAMFNWLNRAWAQRDVGIVQLLIDPFVLRYRSDPRFAAFCRNVGLPTTTDAVAMK